MSFEAPTGASSQESVEPNVHTAEYNGKTYNVDTLMRLSESLPEETVSVESLSAMLDGNYWKDKKGNWLGPHHVLGAVESDVDWDELARENPDWEDQLAKIRNADYDQHPLLLVGEDFVIDGMHRLTRAALEGATEIKVRHFSELPKEAIYENESESS